MLTSDRGLRRPTHTAILPWRGLTHLGSLLPLLWIGWDALRGDLTANPIQALTQRTGKAALVLLVLSLACTPAQSLGFRTAGRLRRTLGLYAFGYAALHVLLFVGVDYGWDFTLILADVGYKRYILAGLAAFLILVPLAITSFRYWQKHLGRTWKRLHRLVYAAGILAVVHYLWQVKADIRQPLWFALIVATLLLVRIPVLRRRLSKWTRSG